MFRPKSAMLLLTLWMACLCSALHAQFKAGIQGTVSDPTGAIVPGAKVVLTNTGTARALEATTSEAGFYRISGLPPGTYKLTVERDGFKKKELENVVIGAETLQGLDVVLELGEVTDTITVSADATPVLQTETATIDRGITDLEIQRLPQFGRDPYELIRLTPGVFGSGARGSNGASVGLPNTTGPGGSNNSIFQTENQVPISANGQRLSANNYQIDGVSVNSQTWGGAAVVTPNQESVKEVRVASSSYTAEDGRNSGAQVKVVTQNGTNELHGSAVIKYNDPDLNAFNKYGGPDKAPPRRVEQLFRQFGASLGGPVIKNKLFYFFSYEGLRNNSTSFYDEFVETPQFRQMILSQRASGLTAKILQNPGIEPRIVSPIERDCGILSGRPCQVVAGGLDIGSPSGSLGQYVPFSMQAAGGGLDGIPDLLYARLAAPSRVNGNQYNFRVDYNLSSNDQIALSTYITQFEGLSSDTAGRSRPLGDLLSDRTNPALTLTYIRILSPSMINEARFSFARFGFNEIQSNQDVNFGIPRLEVEALPFDRIRFGAPRGEGTPGIFAENTFNFRDTLSKVVGAHALKFGVDLQWEQSNNNLLGGARPLYSFVGLWNLANDTPIFEAINADPRTGRPADGQRYFRTRDSALFVQHDWKVRPNLTLNLGLRWEYFTPLREKRGQLSNLLFGSKGLEDSRVQVVDELFAPDRNNFAPRLGFAWSPNWLQSKLVLRGGYGIGFNRLPLAPFLNSRGNPPFFARHNICCGTAATDFGSPFAGNRILYVLGANNSPSSYPINPALAQGIDPVTGGVLGSSVEIYGAPPEVPNAYVHTYSLEVQYDLPGRMVGSLGYQGSASHKLVRLVQQNFLFKSNPSFFAVYFPTPDVNANFNAMNARLSRRFAQGFQFDGIYRWSKSIDTLSYEGPGFVTNQSYPQDQRFERGPSDYDVGHHFVLSGLWDLPILRGRQDWLGSVFGGWQINGILTAHTGFPWTPLIGECVSTPGGPELCPSRPAAYLGGALQDSNDDAFIRAGGNFPGGGAKFFDTTKPGSRPPGIGRNVFRGPRYSSVDFSFVKRIELGRALKEGAGLELRANFFNAFNLRNLGNFGFFTQSTDVRNPNFGRATTGLAGRVVELQARFNF
ncbi:MAG: TonB-dependent receptor [Acidobacteriota bacterium]